MATLVRVFKFVDYQSILRAYIEVNSKVHGYQSRLAKAAGVHPSFLSRVLKGTAQLSPDQATALGEYWKLSTDEALYFINLVHLARATGKEWKRRLQLDNELIRDRNHEVPPGLVVPSSLAQDIYFTSWCYSAVHLLLTTQAFSQDSLIAKRLGLSLEQVKNALETLQLLGLAEPRGTGWGATQNSIAYSSKSWTSAVHHSNWRNRNIMRVHERDSSALHYTGVHPLSRDEFLKIREMLQDALLKVDKTERPSQADDIYCLTLDWLKV